MNAKVRTSDRVRSEAVTDEKALRKRILDALDSVGIWAFHVQSGKVQVRGGWMQLSPDGTPDIYCPGLGWLEVKVPNGKARPNQVQWHERARMLGERVAVVTSVPQALETVMGWRKGRTG